MLATAITDTFANLPDGEPITVESNTRQANYEGGGGNDLTLTVVQYNIGRMAENVVRSGGRIETRRRFLLAIAKKPLVEVRDETALPFYWSLHCHRSRSGRHSRKSCR
jgi:hypothetical protein